MAPYYPVTVCRSDGCQEYAVNGIKFANCPKDTTRSQDVKSRVYNKLDSDHPKTIVWRIKLGGMMMEQLYGPGQNGMYGCQEIEEKVLILVGKHFVLKDLPDGYVLWEHSADPEDVTPDAKKSDQGVSTGSKKGRGDARTDTYLYGHPEGRTKRFRSPQDFLPHLLWLATDKDGDPNNCTCKLCSPGQKDVEKPEEAQVSPKKESSASSVGPSIEG